MQVPQFSPTLRYLRILLSAVTLTALFCSPIHAATTQPIRLAITDIRVTTVPLPGTLLTQQSITVTGNVTNNSSQVLSDDLSLITTRELGTRTELSQLLTGQSDIALITHEDLKYQVTALAPGQSEPWSLTFLADSVFDLTTSGVVGIGVSLGSYQVLTALPWFYWTQTLDPTRVSFAIQLATQRSHAPTGTVTDISGDQIELDRLLTIMSMTASSNFEWLIDPALRVWLADFTGSDLEELANELLDVLNSRTEHIATQIYGQANVSALIGASQNVIVQDIATSYSNNDVYYLLPDGELSVDLLRKLKKFPEIIALTNNAVVSGSELITVSAVGQINSDLVLVSDQGVQNCFSQPGDDFSIIQCLESSLAMITAESPNKSRHILIVTPPSWNPSTSMVARLVANLSQASWMTATDMSLRTMNTQAPEINVAATDELPVFSSKFVKSLKSLLKQATALDTLFPNASISTQLRNAAYLATSHNWASSSAAEAALTAAALYAREVTSGVSVETSSKFTIAGQQAELPLTIVNSASQPVKVGVIIAADNASRLQTQPSGIVTVPSNQRVTVSVPVTLIGAGSVTANVSLITVSGASVGKSSRITINSTAYQDFARNLVYGAFVALILLASNNYRVRRRQLRSVQVSDRAGG